MPGVESRRSGGRVPAHAERPAYGSIVGSGVNATVLHYRKNDRKLKDGDLVLIDAGCEYDYYASDVTRTFPANGKFSPPSPPSAGDVSSHRSWVATESVLIPNTSQPRSRNSAIRPLTAVSSVGQTREQSRE